MAKVSRRYRGFESRLSSANLLLLRKEAATFYTPGIPPNLFSGWWSSSADDAYQSESRNV